MIVEMGEACYVRGEGDMGRDAYNTVLVKGKEGDRKDNKKYMYICITYQSWSPEVHSALL